MLRLDVPTKWSLRFYAARYVKSHTTPDIVFVSTKWSLRFYAAGCVKSHATADVFAIAVA